jgi:hypothetical protein
MKKAHAGAGENGNFVFLKLLRWTSELLVRRLSESTAFKIISQMTNYTKVLRENSLFLQICIFNKEKNTFCNCSMSFLQKNKFT